MSTVPPKDTPVILNTGLFNDTNTLATAVRRLDIPDTHFHELNPNTMNDRDWDDVLNLVLSTTRVITL